MRQAHAVTAASSTVQLPGSGWLTIGGVAICALAAIAAVLAVRPAAPSPPAHTAPHEPIVDADDSGSNTGDIAAA